MSERRRAEGKQEGVRAKRSRRKAQKRKRIILITVEAAAVLLLFGVLLFLLLGDTKEKGTASPVMAELLESADVQGKIEEAVKEEESTVKEIPTEREGLTEGIDVSEYQGNIDWEKTAQEELDFVMVRVGVRRSDTGEIAEDACARYNLQEARDQGLKLGAYFFSTAVSEEEAREEARFTAELLAGYPITYPVAYNCEGFQSESSRQHHLIAEERTRIACAFLDEIEAQGYTGMFYAARNELAGDSQWQTSILENRYRIWVAQYGAGTYPDREKPEYSGEYVMWQYTNEGSVSGIRGGADKNAAYIQYSETAAPKKEGTAGEVTADPEVGVKFTEVSEQVTAKDEANLRTTMDQGSDGNIAARLHNGETALRTGEGNNGWSRVEYDGQVLYCVSSLLTSDLSYTPPKEEKSEFKTKFTSVSEQVTAKDVTNLRNRPSVEEPSQVIAELHHGEIAVRTGISDVGWSRVEYNGQTLYCISSYLELAE